MPLPAISAPDLDENFITSVEELERIIGTPAPLSIDKVSPVLTPGMQAFINQSPLYLIGTADAEGACDVSPRGDPAGAILIRDETTLILPDRRGNKRVDSLRNILRNPSVGILFLIPGSDETLRVNGRARISQHPDLLALMSMRGVTPTLAVIVTVDEAFMHCARAFRRSALWNPESWPDRSEFPSMAAILHEQLHMEGTVEDVAKEREERYRMTLY